MPNCQMNTIKDLYGKTWHHSNKLQTVFTYTEIL